MNCRQDMDETSDEEDGSSSGIKSGSRLSGLAGVGSELSSSVMGLPNAQCTGTEPNEETRDMSVSTLHLYDLHLSQVYVRSVFR